MTLIEGSRSADENLKLIILEARDRVGGRTCTESLDVQYDNQAIDVGGQWVGPTQLRVLKLVEQFELKLQDQARHQS